MTKLALDAGLDSGPTELQIQRSTLADLLLIVAALISLVGTAIDFFRKVNIIEFKSDTDRFDKEAFSTQVGRVNIWYGRNSKIADFADILNVIILARYQPEVFDFAQERNCPFEMVNGQDWLWTSRQGLQDVVIVICERLPIEPRYFDWLLFIPAKSEKWERFVDSLLEQRDWERLLFLKMLRSKEFAMFLPDIDEVLAQYSPEQLEKAQEDWAWVTERWLPKTIKTRPALIQQVLGSLLPEERVVGLTPEEEMAVVKLLLEKQRTDNPDKDKNSNLFI